MNDHSYSSGVGQQFEESSEQLYHEPEDENALKERVQNAGSPQQDISTACAVLDFQLKASEDAQSAVISKEEQQKAECSAQPEHREGVGGQQGQALLDALSGAKPDQEIFQTEEAGECIVHAQIGVEAADLKQLVVAEQQNQNDKSFDDVLFGQLDENELFPELPKITDEQRQQEHIPVAVEKIGAESFNADEFCGSDVDDTIQPEVINAESTVKEAAKSQLVQAANAGSEAVQRIEFAGNANAVEHQLNAQEFGPVTSIPERIATEPADVKLQSKQQTEDFDANSLLKSGGAQCYALIVNAVVDGDELDITNFGKDHGFQCEARQYFVDGASVPKTLVLTFANRTIATNALVLMWTLYHGIRVVQCREDCVNRIAAILSDPDFGICISGLPKECREKDIRDMLRDNAHIIGVKLSGGDAFLVFDDKNAATDALVQCTKVFQDNLAAIKVQKAAQDCFDAFFGKVESQQQSADDFKDATEDAMEWKRQDYQLDELHDVQSKKKQKLAQQEPKSGRVWPQQKAASASIQKSAAAAKAVDKIEITIDEPAIPLKEVKPKLVVSRAKTSDQLPQGQAQKQSRQKRMQSWNQREPAKINKIEIAPIEPGPLNSIELRPQVDQAHYAELCRQFTALCSQMESNLRAFARMDFSRFGAK